MAEKRNPGSLAATRAPNAFCLAAERSEDNPALAELQVRARPSPEAIAACDEFVLDELYHSFDLIGQLRDCFRHAVELHKLLSPERPTGGVK